MENVLSVNEFLLDCSQLSEGRLQLAMWIRRLGGSGDESEPFTLGGNVVSRRDGANVDILNNLIMFLSNLGIITVSSTELFLWKNKLTGSGVIGAGNRVVQDADGSNKDACLLDSKFIVKKMNSHKVYRSVK